MRFRLNQERLKSLLGGIKVKILMFQQMIHSPNEGKERYCLAQEYEFLSKRPYLSDSDEICLNRILEVAQSDEILSNLLEEIDLKSGYELGLLDEKSEEENEKIRRSLQVKLNDLLSKKSEVQ